MQINLRIGITVYDDIVDLRKFTVCLFIALTSAPAYAEPERGLGGNFVPFYDWAYPKRVDGAVFTAVFNDDLTPKKYRWDSASSRNEAYLDANKILAPAVQPGFLETPIQPINSILGFKITFQPGYALNQETMADGLLEELRTKEGTLTGPQRIVFSRDLWNVILQLRSGARIQKQQDIGVYNGIKSLEKKLGDIHGILLTSSHLSGRGLMESLTRQPEIGDLIDAMADESWRKFFGDIHRSQKLVEEDMDRLIAHLAAFNGASLMKMWKWDDGAGNKGAILLRYVTVPVGREGDMVKPIAWIEEVNISGIGGKPPGLDPTGKQPWLMSFNFDRNLFMQAFALGKDNARPHGYLIPRDMEAPVFVGFAGDTLGGPQRASRRVVTRKVSCIECHGGVSSDDELRLVSGEEVTADLHLLLKYHQDQKAYELGFPEFKR